MTTRRKSGEMMKGGNKPPKQKAGPPQDRVKAILEAADELTEEDRAELNARGFQMPLVTPQDNERVFGYRCKACNSLAMEFVGSMFKDRFGNVVDYPPTSAQIHVIPWRQPGLDVHDINRMRPRCQHCGCPVPLRRGTLIERYIVPIDEWQKAKDKADAATKKRRNQRVRGTRRKFGDQTDEGLTNTDGSSIALADKPGAEGSLPAGASRDVPDASYPNDGQVSALKDLSDKHGLAKSVFGEGPG